MLALTGIEAAHRSSAGVPSKVDHRLTGALITLLLCTVGSLAQVDLGLAVRIAARRISSRVSFDKPARRAQIFANSFLPTSFKDERPRCGRCPPVMP